MEPHAARASGGVLAATTLEPVHVAVHSSPSRLFTYQPRPSHAPRTTFPGTWALRQQVCTGQCVSGTEVLATFSFKEQRCIPVPHRLSVERTYVFSALRAKEPRGTQAARAAVFVSGSLEPWDDPSFANNVSQV